jgi:hypothetical protein
VLVPHSQCSLRENPDFLQNFRSKKIAAVNREKKLKGKKRYNSKKQDGLKPVF